LEEDDLFFEQHANLNWNCGLYQTGEWGFVLSTACNLKLELGGISDRRMDVCVVNIMQI
jgi:hypothetical protein